MIALSDEQILLVHKVIHKLVEPHDGVRIGGKEYKVYKHQNGSRAIDIGDTIWIAQNENTNTAFAQLARDGHRITWGMHKGEGSGGGNSSWAQVLDERIMVPIQPGLGSRGSDFGSGNGGFGGGLPPGY